MIVRLELLFEGTTDPLTAVREFAEAMTEWQNYEYDLLDNERGATWVVRPGYPNEAPQIRREPDPGGWRLV